MAVPVAAEEPGFDGLANASQPLRPEAGESSASDALFDLAYDVQVRLRNWKCDSDMLAGGKLLMAGKADGKGGMALSLVRPLEHPYKFFWVKAIAVAEQVKCGCEVTLDAGTWEARGKADEQANHLGQAAYERWKRTCGGKRNFDGTYSFYVIGDPKGRLNMLATPSGKLEGVVNRMTHRWLPRGFNNWLTGKPEEGYGFWAEDSKPPDWEPNCYKGLVTALRLMAADGFKDGSAEATAKLGKDGKYTLQHWGVPQNAAGVLSALVPRAAGQLEGWGNPTLRYNVAEAGEQAVVVAGSTGTLAVEKGGGLQYSVDHLLRFDRQERRLTHLSYSVHVRKGDNPELKLRITLAPHR